MSSVVLSGDTSGTVTVSVPAVAGSNTVTIPALTGTVFIAGQSSAISSGTVVASTSGTSIDFTSLPTWVKRITVMFNGVSTNSTSAILLQIGSGSISTTGYVSGSQQLGSAAIGSLQTSAAGIVITSNFTAAQNLNGATVLTTLGSNVWVAQGTTYLSSTGTYVAAGSVTLSGVLDRIRVTTATGTDTFDAGSINILYE